MVRKIAITGAPSSGKTTIIGILSRLLDGRVLVVPEVPTLFFHSGLGLPEWQRIVSNAETDTAMMKGIVSLRHGLEKTFHEIAALGGFPGLLIDRGTPDAASYLEDPVRDYGTLFERDLEADVLSYHAVIQLGAPVSSPLAGLRHFGGKASDPPEDRIGQLEARLREIWERNGRYHFVSAEMELAKKLTTVIGIVESLLIGA